MNNTGLPAALVDNAIVSIAHPGQSKELIERLEPRLKSLPEIWLNHLGNRLEGSHTNHVEEDEGANLTWLETITPVYSRYKKTSFLYSAIAIRRKLKPLQQQQQQGWAYTNLIPQPNQSTLDHENSSQTKNLDNALDSDHFNPFLDTSDVNTSAPVGLEKLFLVLCDEGWSAALDMLKDRYVSSTWSGFALDLLVGFNGGHRGEPNTTNLDNYANFTAENTGPNSTSSFSGGIRP
ncbi:hypothetical protein M8J77_014391 [Diaphorina citri]|nr:hypothetical protein M8J77_014391 [Diaphorina citri]